jgi:hypothetical protein
MSALLASSLVAAGVVGCAEIEDRPDASGVSPGVLVWDLPRTTIDIDVSFALADCSDAGGLATTLKIVPSATVTPKPVLDLPARRRIVVANLSGWRTANSVGVTPYSSGIIKTLGAKPSDQTGAIVGGVLATVAKVVSFALPAPSPGLPPPTVTAARFQCGPKYHSLAPQMKTLKAELLSRSLDDKQLAAVTSRITRLQSALTIKKSTDTLDPQGSAPGIGETPVIDHGSPYQVTLTPEDMAKAGWITLIASGSIPAPVVTASIIRDASAGGQDEVKPLPAAAHYRDPMVAEVVLKNGGDELDRKQVGFGQFGIPRNLPMTAGLFETLDWSFTWGEDGQLSDAHVTTTARGVAAADLFGQVASAAGTALSASRQDTPTAQLKADTERKQAQIDNIKTTKALQDLQAGQ